MTATPRRRAATVQRLLDAALEEFAEKGYAASSVEDVCARGGFTRGAFYSSFTSKDELIAALFTREVDRKMAALETLLEGVEHTDDPVGTALDRSLVELGGDRTWTLVATEYTLLAARNARAAEILDAHRTRTRLRLTELIDRICAAAGVTLTMPTSDLVTALVALHDGLALGRVLGAAAVDPHPDPDSVRRNAMRALMRGARDTPATFPQEN